MRALACLSLALGWLALTPGVAAADGLPVPMDGFGTTSIVRPDGEGPRYATVGGGPDTTLLRIDQDGGEITATRRIEGDFTVPLVAIDGTPSGISADGGRLALISPRTNFHAPRRTTSFVVVDLLAGGKIQPRPPLTLRGDFSFDALSPDGRTLFLIEYTSRDYNEYVVREYDLERDRLIRKPVLVPDEEPGEMRGLPMTRATSPDGRWEYTLYDGAGHEPFIHGLDTVASESVCIDLPQLEHRRDIGRVQLSLEPDAGTLAVESRAGGLLATVDTETFAVSDPPDDTPAEPEGTEQSESGGASGVAVGALVVGVALIAAPLLGLRRRHRED